MNSPQAVSKDIGQLRTQYLVFYYASSALSMANVGTTSAVT